LGRDDRAGGAGGAGRQRGYERKPHDDGESDGGPPEPQLWAAKSRSQAQDAVEPMWLDIRRGRLRPHGLNGFGDPGFYCRRRIGFGRPCQGSRHLSDGRRCLRTISGFGELFFGLVGQP
jgi:hypothetical protein